MRCGTLGPTTVRFSQKIRCYPFEVARVFSTIASTIANEQLQCCTRYPICCAAQYISLASIIGHGIVHQIKNTCFQSHIFLSKIFFLGVLALVNHCEESSLSYTTRVRIYSSQRDRGSNGAVYTPQKINQWLTTWLITDVCYA